MDVRTTPVQSRTCNFQFRPTLRWTNFWEWPLGVTERSHMPALQVSATPLHHASPRHEATYLNVTAGYSYTIDQAYCLMCLCHSSSICLISTPFHTSWCPDILPTAVSSGAKRLILFNLCTTQTTSTSTDGSTVCMTYLTTQSTVVLTVWQCHQIRDAQILQ